MSQKTTIIITIRSAIRITAVRSSSMKSQKRFAQVTHQRLSGQSCQHMRTSAAIYTDRDDQLPGDFDRDGDADLADLLLLAEDWLKQTSR